MGRFSPLEGPKMPFPRWRDFSWILYQLCGKWRGKREIHNWKAMLGATSSGQVWINWTWACCAHLCGSRRSRCLKPGCPAPTLWPFVGVPAYQEGVLRVSEGKEGLDLQLFLSQQLKKVKSQVNLWLPSQLFGTKGTHGGASRECRDILHVIEQ